MSTRNASQRNLSSGNLTADRRADYAAMLAEGGDHAAAADLMAQAMDLVPEWAAGWFMLAGHAEKAGALGDARAALTQVIALAPDDVFGARLKLAVLDAGEAPATPPSAYVEGLFDDYADRFDQSLVERLGYTVPASLAALAIGSADPGTRFGRTVDLGCGTGLFGAEIAVRTDHLEGYDLSANMLAKAEAKGLYHHLARADLSLPPDQSGLFDGLARNRSDLVSAADVMMYLGDLEAAFVNLAALVKPGGLVALSVEKSDATEGYELRPSLRYAHSDSHMQALFAKHGMGLIATRQQIIRMDGGMPITGVLYAARA